LFFHVNPHTDGDTTAKKQVNISNHEKIQFIDVVKQGLVEGGINLNGMKNSGKSRLLFTICQTLMNDNAKFDKPIRCIAFDGSESWLYGFSRIPVYDIAENDVQLVTDVKSTEDLEKYEFVNWQLIKLALDTNQHILFRLKSRRPSKRGYAIRQIILYLDSVQRKQRETTANHEPDKRIAYFVDEIQDAFTNRASLRLDNEVFLASFNEARNNYQSYFSANIRETDTAKTIRTKQLNAYGKIPEMDKMTYHRRLEKLYNVNLSEIPQRTWLFEGKIFNSPEFKQQGKPYIVNQAIRQRWFNSMPKAEPEKAKSPVTKFFELIFPMMTLKKNLKERQTKPVETQPKDDESEYDQIFTLPEDDSLLPPDSEEF